MITHYALKNFKSFRKQEELLLSNITLIYGQNSSGKSSIIQSLLLMKQTILGQDVRAGLITSGENINLGEYKTLINKHEENLNIGFILGYEKNISALQYEEELNQKPIFGMPDKRELRLIYGGVNSGDETFSYLKSFKYSVSTKNNAKDSKFLFELKSAFASSGNKSIPRFFYRDINNNLFRFIKDQIKKMKRIQL